MLSVDKIKKQLEKEGFNDATHDEITEFIEYLQRRQSPSATTHQRSERPSNRRSTPAGSRKYQATTESQSEKRSASVLGGRFSTKCPYRGLNENEESKCIRPPHLLSNHHHFPIYKKDMCYPPPGFHGKQKQWDEKHLRPAKLPGHGHQREEWAWQLHRKMIYSHPDYDYDIINIFD